MTSLELTRKIAEVLDEKKATDIKAIKVGSVTSIGDYFVVTSGKSIPQVKSLADEIEIQLAKLGIKPTRIEGYQTSSWILLDYNEVIVHIFLGETREFYALEKLWSDAPTVDLSDILTAD